MPPVFRVSFEGWKGALPDPSTVSVTTIRDTAAGPVAKQHFAFRVLTAVPLVLQSTEEIPEPHEFRVEFAVAKASSTEEYYLDFKEHDHGHHGHAATASTIVQDGHDETFRIKVRIK